MPTLLSANTLLLFFIAAAFAAHTAFAADSCEVITTYATSSCSGDPIDVGYTPNPSSCTSQPTCTSGVSDLAAGYRKVECASTACEQPPSGGDAVSLTLSLYQSTDCSGTAYTSTTLGTCDKKTHNFMRDGWIWSVEYDTADWCATKVGNMESWAKTKPGCVPYGAGSAMVAVAMSCQVTTTYATSTCSGSPVGVDYTPNPSSCTSQPTCTSGASDLAAGYRKVECASTACEQPPSGGDAVSPTLSVYQSTDCSGTAYLSITEGTCDKKTHNFMRDGWIWSVEYDTDNWCTTKMGNMESWTKTKPGCVPYGTGSARVSGAMRVGVTMAGVVMLIVAALFAL